MRCILSLVLLFLPLAARADEPFVHREKGRTVHRHDFKLDSLEMEAQRIPGSCI